MEKDMEKVIRKLAEILYDQYIIDLKEGRINIDRYSVDPERK